MDPAQLIRCPRCLTDNEVHEGVDRVVCPVCGTSGRRVHCPSCGGTHVIDEAWPAATCPETGIGFAVASMAAPQTGPLVATTSGPTRSGRSLRPVAVLVAVVIVAVGAVIVVHDHHTMTDTDPVHQVVLDELNAAGGQNGPAACSSLHTYATSRDELQHLLDSVPPAVQGSFIASLKSAASSWLPTAAAKWNFVQGRDALLFLWDECHRRHLGD